jgi:hypothetical protein
MVKSRKLRLTGDIAGMGEIEICLHFGSETI